MTWNSDVAVQLGFETKLIPFIKVEPLIWISRKLEDQVNPHVKVGGHD